MADGSDETGKERIDRELIELLNELRVALPGVQVLFAFLLTLPFTQRFEDLSGSDRNVFFVAIVLTALSSAFLMAPSAHHRVRFRSKAKEQLLKAANVFAIVGLALLAAAMATVMFFVTDVVYDSTAAAITAAATGGFITVVWFVVPRFYRRDDAR